MRPCVRSATLNGYPALARSLGLDPAKLMTGVGLDVADLATPDKWIPAGNVARLLDLSANRGDCPDFALRLAEYRRLSTLGPLSVVLREEPDLRSALDLLARYQRNYNEALRVRVEEANGVVSIRLWFEFGEPVPVRQSTELAVAALHGILREFLGPDWHPLAICFSHSPPEDLGTHRKLFGPRLQFDHEFAGLLLYPSDLDAQNAMADPLLRPYAQQFLQSMAQARAANSADRVRELVEFLLPLGRCSMDQIARNIGVDSRTLHRHLAQQDESFTSIVHTTRAALAERYLANDRYSLTDVSQMLGFSAPSAFTRWFRQQFHESPTQWRNATRRTAVSR
ncbi:MAG TPA: AraC family transcriptional regulator [Jatrophihabitantaceae bacterium]|jgi:AraC-like DNA-binding protein